MKRLAAMVVLLAFTSFAFATPEQQVAPEHITLTIRTLTVSAEKLNYDSETGVLKASGDVSVVVNNHLKVSTEDMELTVDRTKDVVDGRTQGHIVAAVTEEDGSIRNIDTNGMHFVFKF